MFRISPLKAEFIRQFQNPNINNVHAALKEWRGQA